MAAAGCTSEGASPPEEGDVRLVSVDSIGSPTAECDPVHFGGVEVFTGGMWARICDSGDRFTPLANVLHPIAAQVRQSGFVHEQTLTSVGSMVLF